MSQQNIPFIVYAESTPNPATMKFVANRMLIPEGITFESADPNGNDDAPLAQAIFNFSFVDRVYIANNFVAISKTDAIEWEDIVHQVREFVSDYVNNGGQVYIGSGKIEEPAINVNGEDYTAITKHREPRNDMEKNIIAILDEYVRPAVESDGGAILFDSYDSGKVNLILKGSCSGCPSSVMTLKSGVENLLKQMMPKEVEEVIALNG